MRGSWGGKITGVAKQFNLVGVVVGCVPLDYFSEYAVISAILWVVKHHLSDPRMSLKL